MVDAVALLPPSIRGSKTLKASTLYIVSGEVRIKSGAVVTIEDGCEIRLVNGRFPKSSVRRSALIFEPGSQMKAKNFALRAADADFKAEKSADNGGIWFLGNSAAASKDGIAIKRTAKSPLSSFVAGKITTSYLGRHDTSRNTKSGKRTKWGDDIDAISLLGLSEDEWSVKSISSRHSADDGIDITNSHISLDRLEIVAPVEDAINLSNSQLQIKKALTITLQSDKRDCHLFDLEVDDGPAFLALHTGCAVNIQGALGNQLTLVSSDIKPAKGARNPTLRYKGRIKRKPTLIFSISAD